MRRRRWTLLAPLACAIAAGCGPLRRGTVWREPDYASPARAKSLRLALERESGVIPIGGCAEFSGIDPAVALLRAERAYAAGVHLQKDGSPACVDQFLAAACFAFVPMLDGATIGEADQQRAATIYASALSQYMKSGQQFGTFDPRSSATDPAHDGRQAPIVHRVAPWEIADLDELIPVGDYRSDDLKVTIASDGVGVPMVAVRRGMPGDDTRDRFLAAEHPFAVTALLAPDPNWLRSQLALHKETSDRNNDAPAPPSGLLLVNAMRYTHVEWSGRLLPLRRDLTAPLAFRIERAVSLDLGWLGFREPELAAESAGLFLLEPHQPGKIPIVLVHGLMSSPTTWSDMINGLRAHADLLKRYQLAVFRYPTGVPFLVSASRLRVELDRFRDTLDPGHDDAALDEMVLIGHSMGGLLTRLQVADSGNAFWNALSSAPFEQTKMSPTIRASIERVFFFRARSDVGRAIFIATPHHGAGMSRRIVGQIGSLLVKAPDELTEARAELVRLNPGQFSESSGRFGVNSSVDELSPKSRSIRALQQTRFAEKVRLHTILGTYNDVPGMRVGDGLVSISSALLAEAESTLEVHANHVEVHHRCESIREVVRILRAHLAEFDGKNSKHN